MLCLVLVGPCHDDPSMPWSGDIWAPDTPRGRASLDALAVIWNRRCGKGTHLVKSVPTAAPRESMSRAQYGPTVQVTDSAT
jgi:hypothetical protein